MQPMSEAPECEHCQREVKEWEVIESLASQEHRVLCEEHTPKED